MNLCTLFILVSQLDTTCGVLILQGMELGIDHFDIKTVKLAGK